MSGMGISSVGGCEREGGMLLSAKNGIDTNRGVDGRRDCFDVPAGMMYDRRFTQASVCSRCTPHNNGTAEADTTRVGRTRCQTTGSKVQG